MKEGMKTKRTRAIQNVPADAPGQGRMLIDSDTSRAIHPQEAVWRERTDGCREKWSCVYRANAA